MTFLYFAYGSNLLRQRLHMDNPSAKFVDVAELKDHTLKFNSLDRRPETLRWRGGAATIIESPGDSVWGCVWRLANEHMPTLDRQESVYDAKDVKVSSDQGKEYTCRTYQLPDRYFVNAGFDQRPSPMYLDVIVKGAIQNCLPGHYIKFLESVETNGFKDNNLKIYQDILKQMKLNNEDL